MLENIDKVIKTQFGSKRGLLKASRYRLALLLGRYRRCQEVDFPSIRRLVFICSGNICRSPLAEAAAIKAGVPAISYGLHCRGGDGANPRAKVYAAQHGLSLENHITKNISSYHPETGDLLVGMEPRHTEELFKLFPDGPVITLAGLWLDKPNAYIHDPLNSNDYFFRECEQLVVDATHGLAKQLEPPYAKSG